MNNADNKQARKNKAADEVVLAALMGLDTEYEHRGAFAVRNVVRAVRAANISESRVRSALKRLVDADKVEESGGYRRAQFAILTPERAAEIKANRAERDALKDRVARLTATAHGVGAHAEEGYRSVEMDLDALETVLKLAKLAVDAGLANVTPRRRCTYEHSYGRCDKTHTNVIADRCDDHSDCEGNADKRRARTQRKLRRKNRRHA